MRKLSVVGVCLLLFVQFSFAVTIYVSDDSEVNGPGTAWSNAFNDIQAAVDVSVDNDIILIKTYEAMYVPSQIFVSNNITIKGYTGNPDDTFVLGYGTNRIFNLGNSSCILANMTIRDGYVSGWSNNGGGVLCSGTNPVISNCIISHNSAFSGGGCFNGTLNNCGLFDNEAVSGGGVSTGILNNCTISGNNANVGGGCYNSTLNNCIIYSNTASSYVNYSGGRLNYCCTTPLPTGGTGNITANPMLLDNIHIALGSPCIGSGSTLYSSGTDIDGTVWLNPPSIGCDEVVIYYVSIAGGGHVAGTHTSPFRSWATAATNIQDAVDVAAGNTFVLLDDDHFYTVSQIVVDTNIIIRGRTGNPQDVIVERAAGDTHRIFYLGNSDCRLENMTITNGSIPGEGGGGVYCTGTNPVIYNCILSGNSSKNGGGSYLGKLYRCILSDNDAISGGGSYSGVLDGCALYENSSWYGGGSYEGKLDNCTIISNSAVYEGGGTYKSALKNCIVYYNYSSSSSNNNYYGGSMTACCTIPHFAGALNISDVPGLIDYMHIRNSSPCAAAGTALYSDTTDIDGQAWNREHPSIGCDELPTHYVSITGGSKNAGSHNPPFTSWDTAATNIQAALDAASDNSLIWLDSDTFITSSEIIVSNSVMLLAKGRYDCATIDADGSHRVFNLDNNNCILRWLIITNGMTSGDGGGILCSGNNPVIESCIIAGNTASGDGGGCYAGTLSNCRISSNSANYGGGVYEGQLNNCFLLNNQASFGGGSSGGMLNNCTIIKNSADYGGGSSGGTLKNCIIYSNLTTNEYKNYIMSTMDYCCTTPMPSGGVGNITGNPDLTMEYILRSSSPCIDAGDNNSMLTADYYRTSYLQPCRPLDGDNNGTAIVDIGCYEYMHSSADSDGDTIPDSWEFDWHMDPTDPTDGQRDTDGDHASNSEEYIADTSPIDGTSYLSVTAVSNSPLSIYFASLRSRQYVMQGCNDLATPVWSNIPGTGWRQGVDWHDKMQDTNAVPHKYYRISVRLP